MRRLLNLMEPLISKVRIWSCTRIGSMILTCVSVALLWIFLFRLIHLHAEKSVWDTETVDKIVIFTLISSLSAAIGVFGFSIFHSPSEEFNRFKESLFTLGAVLVALATLYVAYATFRNQMRLSAESNLRTEGLQIFDLEMDDENLRCIYRNHGHNDFDKCIDTLTENPKNWSKVIFYVEESLWLIEQASREEIITGSEYSKVIDYWRDYISDDPTGIFSYYAVSDKGSVADAVHFLRSIGVKPSNVCRKYKKVFVALQARHAAPPQRYDAACNSP